MVGGLGRAYAETPLPTTPLPGSLLPVLVVEISGQHEVAMIGQPVGVLARAPSTCVPRADRSRPHRARTGRDGGSRSRPGAHRRDRERNRPSPCRAAPTSGHERMPAGRVNLIVAGLDSGWRDAMPTPSRAFSCRCDSERAAPPPFQRTRPSVGRCPGGACPGRRLKAQGARCSADEPSGSSPRGGERRLAGRALEDLVVHKPLKDLLRTAAKKLRVSPVLYPAMKVDPGRWPV